MLVIRAAPGDEELIRQEGEKCAPLKELAEGLTRSVNWTTEEASEKFLDAWAEDQAHREERMARLLSTQEKEPETIKFKAEVAKVQTMADGGVRVVLDLGEDGRRVMEALTECKQKGIVLDIDAVTRKS